MGHQQHCQHYMMKLVQENGNSTSMHANVQVYKRATEIQAICH